ncbi:hypothetical protein BU15DRAFT_64852 [Melanogaster broomeanus]|nr:hypothetical protein BU15DRAFT_64852 [Melanogaster broomeanus]
MIDLPVKRGMMRIMVEPKAVSRNTHTATECFCSLAFSGDGLVTPARGWRVVPNSTNGWVSSYLPQRTFTETSQDMLAFLKNWALVKVFRTSERKTRSCDISSSKVIRESIPSDLTPASSSQECTKGSKKAMTPRPILSCHQSIETATTSSTQSGNSTQLGTRWLPRRKPRSGTDELLDSPISEARPHVLMGRRCERTWMVPQLVHMREEMSPVDDHDDEDGSMAPDSRENSSQQY